MTLSLDFVPFPSTTWELSSPVYLTLDITYTGADAVKKAPFKMPCRIVRQVDNPLDVNAIKTNMLALFRNYSPQPLFEYYYSNRIPTTATMPHRTLETLQKEDVYVLYTLGAEPELAVACALTRPCPNFTAYNRERRFFAFRGDLNTLRRFLAYHEPALQRRMFRVALIGVETFRPPPGGLLPGMDYIQFRLHIVMFQCILVLRDIHPQMPNPSGVVPQHQNVYHTMQGTGQTVGKVDANADANTTGTKRRREN
ncbi:hypothetical protein O9K51_06062 [Purpureocillium lavendulum]|uniref:Uncharacterized protein n=1 Tax=Purpureocillium lavendulum TaxID=1247861 RepID=A0AB34FMA5_9HYPO|nr:hypothetical protein O9K51_06062 [Purpureocillium lavendulum]